MWNLTFLLLNVSYFLVFFNIGLFYLYPLALQSMGSGTWVIGWVMGLFSIANVLFRPLMGKVAAAKGEYRLLTLGTALITAVSLIYGLITSFGPHMLVARIIHGMGFSAFITASFSMAAKIFPTPKRGQAFGIVGASIMAAISLAPPTGEFLIHSSGFPALYLTAAACTLLAFFALSAAARRPHHPFSPPKAKPPGYAPLLRNISFVFLLISTLIFAHSQSTLANFLALIADEKGTEAGRFFFLTYLVAIVFLLTTGKFIDKYGKVLFLRLFYPSVFLGLVLIPGFVDSFLFFLPAVFFGLGIGALFPAHNALATDHGSYWEKPAVMSVFTAVYDTGFITGAVFSGWVADQLDLDWLFLVTAFLALSGFVLSLLPPLGRWAKST